MKIKGPERLGMSKARLKELEWYVRQYPEKKRRAETDERARQDTERIEQAAEKAAGDLGKYVIENVVTGKAPAALGAPACDKKFYALRRRFLVELDGKTRERK